MSIEELRAEALKLSPVSRAFLARELLASLDDMNDAQIEHLWVDEACSRDNELDEGSAQASPADKVLARARNRRQ
ncbi:putative addiction module component [Geobacter sp. OR-1]|uniref:addiction module protein n=1 Tax=Geobacter sp. OR-1 TaxID=1266765 RepID=UPI0005441D69|nr:addiction module protein [Geobacter sp. OR-1]GAM10688.1 putative addiction module component [Geobacter sp. OR-1]